MNLIFTRGEKPIQAVKNMDVKISQKLFAPLRLTVIHFVVAVVIII